MVVVDGDTRASSVTDLGVSPFDDPINLAFTVEELLVGLRVSAARADWLNVVFASAGMLQAIDDRVAGTSLLSGRLAAAVSKSSPLLGRMAFGWLSFWRAIRRSRRRRWPLVRVRQLLMAIAVGAAARMQDDERDAGIEALAAQLQSSVQHLPNGMRRAVARIPSSFRSFDQHPDDLRRLAQMFTATQQDFQRPLVLVGVRTSGTYLVPFLAAYLQQLGFANIAVIGARSDQPLSFDDARVMRQFAQRNAAVVIVDDPPSSGYALAAVGKSLESYGVDASAVHLLLAVFDSPAGEVDDVLPQKLRGYTSTTLCFDDWSIHSRLSVNAVRTALEDLFHPVVVTDCLIVPLGKRNGRAHQAVRIVATVRDNYGIHELLLLAEGVGLGYFGDHDRAVNERLGVTPPDVLGVRDGILFREWLSEDAIKTPDVTDVVDYIEHRSSVFREPADRSLELAGSQPVWEVASEQIAHVYGRFWMIARVIFVDRLVKALVKSRRYAVPDGAMQTQRWFVVNGTIRKIDVSTRAFGNLDLQTFDPAYDAVAFAVDHGDESHEMRLAFSQRIEPLTNEKWLLYELVRLWDDQRLAVIDRYEAANSRGSALRRYLANVLLSDMQTSAVGPLVALDVDGVIESEVFGFKAPTPSGILGIRALVRHGYRPVVVTGRCVDDVRELVEKFQLTSGVAEYGSALVLRDGSVVSLLSETQQMALDDLRERLRRADGVRIDDRYRHSVRASAVDRDGALGGLDSDVIESVLTADFESVVGVLQTDVVVAGVNKGRGVRFLSEILGDHQLALAVGDTDADISLLESADRRGAASHATKALKAVANMSSKQPYQVGFADIVSTFIGHKVGGCETCAVPALSDDAKAMLALLRTTEGKKTTIAFRTLQAMLAAGRVTR